MMFFTTRKAVDVCGNMVCPGRNQKNVLGGETGPLTPPFWNNYFQPNRKGGGGYAPPPKKKNLGPATENYCQCAAKRRKYDRGCRQFTPKCRKYHELVMSLRGTKYLGGGQKTAPFSGLLKLIVDHNWGAMAPFPP